MSNWYYKRSRINSKDYDDNYDKIFGKKKAAKEPCQFCAEPCGEEHCHTNEEKDEGSNPEASNSKARENTETDDSPAETADQGKGKDNSSPSPRTENS